MSHTPSGNQMGPGGGRIGKLAMAKQYCFWELFLAKILTYNKLSTYNDTGS